MVCGTLRACKKVRTTACAGGSHRGVTAFGWLGLTGAQCQTDHHAEENPDAKGCADGSCRVVPDEIARYFVASLELAGNPVVAFAGLLGDAIVSFARSVCGLPRILAGRLGGVRNRRSSL
jgi:hypothetical protein